MDYNSKETLARMFAEILTYTLEYENGVRKPAICFFEGKEQKQWTEYCKLKEEGNVDLEYIEKYVKVYYFKVLSDGKEKEFEILPID